MTIHITCECGKALHAPDEFAGRQTRCPACARTLMLPAAEQAIQPQPAPLQFAPPADAPPVAETPVQASGTSGKAIFSLILGILGFCVPVLFSVPAVVLGFMGLSSINKSGGRVGGKGMAIAGIIVGFLSFGMVIPWLIVAGTFYFRGKANDTISNVNLKQIGLAMHTYADANNSNLLTEREQGNPGLSWRVHLLPFIEEQNLYNQFNLSEPWDGPTNKRLLSQMPKIYLDPRFQSPADRSKGLTYYRGFVGKDTVLGAPVPVSLGLATSAAGTSNTLVVAEAGEPIEWTRPEGTFDGNSPLGGPKRGNFLALYLSGEVYMTAGKTDPKLIDTLTRWNRTEIVTRP
ncbi:MAG: DUF1559 domain-containing protein [Gemmataceae bacterium]|nr:DUF1559 domain-containing protein [Gemmataceae bacterium]